MKIALFGGAFNPIHNGHIELINVFNDIVHFDKILIMPSKISPHKSSEGLIDGKHRIKMCEFALENMDNAEVSSIEMKREGKSYTYYTIKQLQKMYEKADIYLICGSDMFLTLNSWFNAEYILKSCVICCSKRGDEADEKINKQNEYLKSIGAKTIVIDGRIVPLSSTYIREKLKKNDNCEKILPANVYNYIVENNLYGN